MWSNFHVFSSVHPALNQKLRCYMPPRPHNYFSISSQQESAFLGESCLTCGAPAVELHSILQCLEGNASYRLCIGAGVGDFLNPDLRSFNTRERLGSVQMQNILSTVVSGVGGEEWIIDWFCCRISWRHTFKSKQKWLSTTNYLRSMSPGTDAVIGVATPEGRMSMGLCRSGTHPVIHPAPN
ncbi:uncharacterized protein LAJ45_04607 [Morchella importuna]|uniref:uncharacterized protein n=1 Tax=Morchella importuna TaxID=1174673 RepID=UPI001E8E3532|nr:uncharacterized protein LAJ45_04607 [Morchella importuna]KAH8151403.1 hypothetical protein LAJ45_04607 [Morchella importuna]